MADFRFQVVDETSSRVFASKEETLGIEADHQQMVKFHDDKDSDFKNVVATVRTLQKRATLSTADGARTILLRDHGIQRHIDLQLSSKVLVSLTKAS